MKINLGGPVATFAIVTGLVMLVVSVFPVGAEEDPLGADEDPLVEQLTAIVEQIEDELIQVAAPQELVERTQNAIVDSQVTGLERETFISNLGAELSAIVEDEAALKSCLDTVDDLVAQYQALLEEA